MGEGLVRKSSDRVQLLANAGRIDLSRMRGVPTREARGVVLLVSLICLVWIVAGLIGHDPWKPDEAYSFGLVLSVLEGRDWVVPMLAHEPFMEKPPIYYLTAALTAKVFGGVLPLHDAARLATGFYMALTFILVGLTGRELFGVGRGWIPTLIFVGCAGLPLYGHLLLTDIAQITGFALALYGLALGQRCPHWGGVWLGSGVGVAFMSKGLLAPGCFGVLVTLLPLLSPRWRTRSFVQSLVAAFLAGLPWLVIWPLMLYQRSPDLFMVWLGDNNLGRFLGSNNLGPASSPFGLLRTVAWAALPAWPLALSAVWSARRELTSRPELLLPLALFAVILLTLSVSRQGRDLYALPMLVPLSLLAVPGLLALKGISLRATSAFAMAFFLVLGVVVWFYWAALELSVAGTLHEHLVQLRPTYAPALHLSTLAIALVVTASWLYVVLRFPENTERPAVLWASGVTMVWSLVAVMFMRYADVGNSYRPMVAELRAQLPAGYRCVASDNLGEPQRAMLHYFAGLLTYRYEQDARQVHPCDVLLVQGFRSGIHEPGGNWVEIWKGGRPGDRVELYKLYRWSDSIGTSRTSAARTGPSG